MSHRNVETLLGRLATDPDFRRRFISDREAALAQFREQGYELSAIELTALMSMNAEAIHAFADALDARLRKAESTTR
jgi:hypothetical protein